MLLDNYNRAYAVIAKDRDGNHRKFKARKEIILSAGIFETTKLLKLSGVGPAEELHKFGIPCHADLPVGEKLHSHVGVMGLMFRVNSKVSYNAQRLLTNPLAWLDYIKYRQGPLSGIGGFEGVAFVNTPINKDYDWPDIELIFFSSTFAIDGGYIINPKQLNIKPELFDEFLPLTFGEAFMIVPMLCRPRSRGRLLLRSADPDDNIRLIHNFLADPHDVATLLEGVKLAMSVAASPAFAKYGAEYHETLLPPCKHLAYRSDEYWRCHMRHLTYTIQHDVGGACMGSAYDPTAVVDPQLRVYGVPGLRIADASVFPTVNSGHPTAPVIMVAEKAADLIKQSWLAKHNRHKRHTNWPQKIINNYTYTYT